MTDVEFINAVFDKNFMSKEECENFYSEMVAIYDTMSEKEKEKIRNSMCLEMLERIAPL